MMAQLCLVLFWSSKLRLPMVRAASRVTVMSAGRLTVVKLAVLPEPLAIVAALQLAVLVQLPL